MAKKKNGSQVEKNVMCIFYPEGEIEWRIFFNWAVNIKNLGLSAEDKV